MCIIGVVISLLKLFVSFSLQTSRREVDLGVTSPLISLDRFQFVDFSYYTYLWETIFSTGKPKALDASGTLFSTLDLPTWTMIMASILIVFATLMLFSLVSRQLRVRCYTIGFGEKKELLSGACKSTMYQELCSEFIFFCEVLKI